MRRYNSILLYCVGGEGAAAGERGESEEAAGDGGAVRVALSAAARLDVLCQEVRRLLRASRTASIRQPEQTGNITAVLVDYLVFGPFSHGSKRQLLRNSLTH